MAELNSRILEAAQSRNLTAIKLLFETNRNIESETRYVLEKTIAEIATRKGDLIMLRFISDRSPRILEDRDFNTSTLLKIAITGGYLEIVKHLVDHSKAEVLAPHCLTTGDTYAHLAAELGHLDIFKYFIEGKKIDVNSKNELGQPLIFAAARCARLNIIRYVVEERNADVSMVDSLGRNIFCFSAQKGDLKIPKYLLDKRKLKIAINNTLIIHDAITQNYKVRPAKRVRFLQYFIEGKHVNINSRDKGGKTPLHLAAREGSMDTLKYLIHHGADIHSKNSKGQTPLHLAADEGKFDNVVYLLEQGADIQQTDLGGKTPLHLAASQGKLKIVHYLVRKGANIHAQDSNGKTPLQFAVSENVIKYLTKVEKKRARRSLFKSRMSEPNRTFQKQIWKWQFIENWHSSVGSRVNHTPERIYHFSTLLIGTILPCTRIIFLGPS